MMNTAMLLITPIWPIMTLDGDFERVFAAFITLGARNEEPKPANVKLMHKIANDNILCSAPIKRVTNIPIKNEAPDVKDPILTKYSIENLLNSR